MKNSPCDKCKYRKCTSPKQCSRWLDWFKATWDELREIYGVDNGKDVKG